MQRVLNIQLPSVMSPAAKQRLHELIDEMIQTGINLEVRSGEVAGSPRDAMRRFIEAIRQKTTMEAYLRALLSAGQKGLRLADLGKATGENGPELGGIASGVTKNWRKFVVPGGAIVLRTHKQHRLTDEALRRLGGLKL